ncbi:MAG: flagellar hook-basal body complex protein FliE [Lachnospiraceae bacterium]|nr:flagellar hook-basal body complex protein FliE [Lachnospiraceae bacterium]
MDISSISNISSDYIQAAVDASKETKDQGFDQVFQSMLGMVEETNELQNQKDSEVMKFMLGDAVNTHDLQIAQSKANEAIQYTVAVRDKLLEAYREIMNMQV